MERQTKTIPSSSRIGASQRYMFLSRSPTNKTTHPIYSTRRMKSNSVSFRLLMLSLRYAIPAKTGTTTPRKNLPISCSLMFSNIGCAQQQSLKFYGRERTLVKTLFRLHRASGAAISCPISQPIPTSISAIQGPARGFPEKCFSNNICASRDFYIKKPSKIHTEVCPTFYYNHIISKQQVSQYIICQNKYI